jgi:hypothetical protein
MTPTVTELPVEPTEHDKFYVWDMCEWDGDLDVFKQINDAWMEYHSEPAKIGTISVLPDHVIADGELQDFISEGWTEAAEAAELEYCAIVANGLQGLAVKESFDASWVTVGTFEETDQAVAWIENKL